MTSTLRTHWYLSQHTAAVTHCVCVCMHGPGLVLMLVKILNTSIQNTTHILMFCFLCVNVDGWFPFVSICFYSTPSHSSDFLFLCLQFHKYCIQAEVLRKSWPLDESLASFIQNLRDLERNEMRGTANHRFEDLFIIWASNDSFWIHSGPQVTEPL